MADPLSIVCWSVCPSHPPDAGLTSAAYGTILWCAPFRFGAATPPMPCTPGIQSCPTCCRYSTCCTAIVRTVPTFPLNLCLRVLSPEPYILHLVQAVRDVHMRAVVFTYRGLGGARLKTPRGYSAAATDDLAVRSCMYAQACAFVSVCILVCMHACLLAGKYESFACRCKLQHACMR